MISYKKLVRDIDLDKKIYIAFSGGLDSSVLLHLFSDLKKKDSLNIEAIYVNHNLSKENYRKLGFFKSQTPMFFVTAGATLWTVSFFVCILQLFAQPRILFDSDQFKQS